MPSSSSSSESSESSESDDEPPSEELANVLRFRVLPQRLGGPSVLGCVPLRSESGPLDTALWVGTMRASLAPTHQVVNLELVLGGRVEATFRLTNTDLCLGVLDDGPSTWQAIDGQPWVVQMVLSYAAHSQGLSFRARAIVVRRPTYTND